MPALPASPAVPARPTGLPDGIAHVERTLVMGVLNVTPDSFSDGGRFEAVDAAVAHGQLLARQGADIVDVGGESTRPGAERIDPQAELARVLPVIAGLVHAGVNVSIDTMRAATARAAVEAGACMVNDVSGGLADRTMLTTVRDLGVPCVLMHWRGHSDHMDQLTSYGDVVADVRSELEARLQAAAECGVDLDRVVLDPGLGFAKEAEHNWQLLAGLGELATLGRPLLVGASRKRFLGSLLADFDGVPRTVDERDAATDAITAMAALQGAWAVRVHDVRGSSDAVRVAAAWSAAQSTGSST